MQWLQESFAKHSILLLVANRFLPLVRGLILFASGMAGVSYARAAICSTISAILLNGLLVALGYFVSTRLEHLLYLVKAYSTVLIIVMSLVLCGYLIWRFVLRRKNKQPEIK